MAISKVTGYQSPQSPLRMDDPPVFEHFSRSKVDLTLEGNRTRNFLLETSTLENSSEEPDRDERNKSPFILPDLHFDLYDHHRSDATDVLAQSLPYPDASASTATNATLTTNLGRLALGAGIGTDVVLLPGIDENKFIFVPLLPKVAYQPDQNKHGDAHKDSHFPTFPSRPKAEAVNLDPRPPLSYVPIASTASDPNKRLKPDPVFLRQGLVELVAEED
ncbi:hypothetical protein H2248_003025 [Termitomyces sp. 'cryptogamus']|nr:hypothetical protein H2248_003025 [Termitomyces sp. 'cryptogamus']